MTHIYQWEWLLQVLTQKVSPQQAIDLAQQGALETAKMKAEMQKAVDAAAPSPESSSPATTTVP